MAFWGADWEFRAKRIMYSCIIKIVCFGGLLFVDDSLNNICYNSDLEPHCSPSPCRALPSVFASVLEVSPVLIEGICSGRGQRQSVNGLELSAVQGQ